MVDTALDLDRLRRAVMAVEPFGWGVVHDSFSSRRVAERLAMCFPTAGFTQTVRTEGEKTYAMDDLALVSRSRVIAGAYDRLPAPWQLIIDEVGSDGYRDALSHATGVELGPCVIDVRLCRYSAGCWLSPHTDRPDKRVTHVFYFNQAWQADWGGMLQVMRSPQAGDVCREVAPSLGSSVVMVRSDASWHAVAPLRSGLTVQRRSLLVHFTDGT
jgi:SM-20-related protein